MPNLLLVRPARESYPYRPIGLALLSALAQRRGWRTRLFDAGTVPGSTVRGICGPGPANNSDWRKPDRELSGAISDTLASFSPDLVAVSVVSDNRFTAASITRLIGESDSRVPVVWGGVEPTVNPDRALREFGADIVCRGEGIGAFDDLLEAFGSGGEITGIANLWVKEPGGIIQNPVRPLKADLDDLPFLDLDLFTEFYRAGNGTGPAPAGADHMITHGCPNRCTYCINAFYHALYGGGYLVRQYSPHRIVSELRWIRERYRAGFFNFHDEDFLLKSGQYLEDLADAYRNDVGLPFSVMASPRSVTEEKARLLRRMGCVQVSIGIETGDGAVRTGLLGRPDSPADIHRCAGILKRNGIRTASFNMLGLPFYSREAYEKTVSLNRSAAIDAPYASFFYPYEGTGIRDTAISHGFFYPGDPKTAVHRPGVPALRFPDLTEDELAGMQTVFALYCGLPEEYVPYIRRAETDDEKGRKLRDLLRQILADRILQRTSGTGGDNRLKENRDLLVRTMKEETPLSRGGRPGGA